MVTCTLTTAGVTRAATSANEDGVPPDVPGSGIALDVPIRACMIPAPTAPPTPPATSMAAATPPISQARPCQAGLRRVGSNILGGGVEAMRGNFRAKPP